VSPDPGTGDDSLGPENNEGVLAGLKEEESSTATDWPARLQSLAWYERLGAASAQYAGSTDPKAISQAALVTMRRAILERFPPGRDTETAVLARHGSRHHLTILRSRRSGSTPHASANAMRSVTVTLRRPRSTLAT